MIQERQGRGVESKARLFQAASHIFAERGYYETKISDIVAEAGVSQPTFYAYFDSKEALFAELVGTFRAGLSALVATSRVPDHPTADMCERHLRENLTEIFQYLGSDPVMTRIGLLQAPDSAEVYSAFAAMIAANLAYVQSVGLVRATVETGVIAQAVVGIVHQLTIRYLLTREREPLELADIAIDFIFYGTQAPAHRRDMSDM